MRMVGYVSLCVLFVDIHGIYSTRCFEKIYSSKQKRNVTDLGVSEAGLHHVFPILLFQCDS